MWCSAGDWGQIGIEFWTNHIIYQKLATFPQKKDVMLTGLKVSALACECLFERPEDNANFIDETEFWRP